MADSMTAPEESSRKWKLEADTEQGLMVSVGVAGSRPAPAVMRPSFPS